MIHDSIIIKPLTEMPIDSDGDFVESDVQMDDLDEDVKLRRESSR